jgi:hypothetical protein
MRVYGDGEMTRKEIMAFSAAMVRRTLATGGSAMPADQSHLDRFDQLKSEREAQKSTEKKLHPAAA